MSTIWLRYSELANRLYIKRLNRVNLAPLFVSVAHTRYRRYLYVIIILLIIDNFGVWKFNICYTRFGLCITWIQLSDFIFLWKDWFIHDSFIANKKNRPNYYIVLAYKDTATDKNKTKWLSTDIPVKGNNKRLANEKMKEVLAEYERQKIDLGKDVLFVDF